MSRKAKETRSAVELLPPLYLTVAVDRQAGLITTSNSAQQSRPLEDCRLLTDALEQVLRALRERRVELEVVAAINKEAPPEKEPEEQP